MESGIEMWMRWRYRLSFTAGTRGCSPSEQPSSWMGTIPGLWYPSPPEIQGQDCFGKKYLATLQWTVWSVSIRLYLSESLCTIFCIYGLEVLIILTACLKEMETLGIERNSFFPKEKILYIGSVQIICHLAAGVFIPYANEMGRNMKQEGINDCLKVVKIKWILTESLTICGSFTCLIFQI